MSLSIKRIAPLRWFFRLIKYGLYLAFFLLVLVCLVLVLLPTVISTDFSHDLIQENISKALDRPVAIQTLDWSWSDGMIIRGFSIPDLPEFSDDKMISLAHLKIRPDVRKLLSRKAFLEFAANDVTVIIIKTPDGQLNLQTLGPKPHQPETTAEHKPPEKQKKDKTGQKEEKPLTLPSVIRDAAADIKLENISVIYDDRQKEETFQISNLDIRFSVPSLKTAPLKLFFATDIKINGHALPRSELSVSVEKLFTEDGLLNINGVAAALDADLPGIIANAHADLAASKIDAGIQMDLTAIMAAAGPLLRGIPSPTDIDGDLELNISSDTRPDAPLAFDATLSGTGLAIGGKIIDGKRLGPGDLSIHLNGILDLDADNLTLATGNITILENSLLHFSGSVDQITGDDRKIMFSIAPLYLDIDEIGVFAAPFIPPTVKIDPQTGINSFVSLNELRIDGHLPTGASVVSLDDLKIHLPDLAITDKTDGATTLHITGSHVKLETLSAHLADLFPATGALKLSLSADKLISGKADDAISVSGIRLDLPNAEFSECFKANDSKFGISGKIILDERLMIDQIMIPKMARISDLTHSLKINAEISPHSTLAGKLDHLDVAGKKVTVLKQGIGPINTDVDIHLSLDELFLKNLDPLNIDITGLAARVAAGNAISISATANAVDTATTSFNADIKINSDLYALTGILPPELLSGLSGAGKLELTLSADGRRPDEAEIIALSNKQIKNQLSFLHTLNCRVILENGFLRISRPESNPIVIDAITARPLITYALDGKTGTGKISSNISAGSVSGLPGIQGVTPVSGAFSVAGEHIFATSVDLDQSLSISPVGINETVHITIDGLDHILSPQAAADPAVYLSKIGADISARLKIPELKMLKELGLPGLSNVDLKGLLDAGVLFTLIPEKTINGGILLTVKDMDMAVPGIVSVKNINANMDFSKSYEIKSRRQLLGAGIENPGLSFNVMETAPQTGTGALDTDVYRHIRLLHERMNPDPAISFEAADVKAAPFPLSIDESLIMVKLDDGLPNLDYFQFNLLGGTINGSIALEKIPAGFKTKLVLSFSGINTAQIFPDAFSKKDYAKAGISGMLSADFPLTEQLQTMLESASMSLEFTRIGSRALERLLYALDPYESNEAIVSQRQFLKNGSPKKIRVEVRDGFFSLTGNVSIKGIDISLPAIRRLNIAQLPGLEKFEKNLSGLVPVLNILKKAAADQIIIDKEARIVAFD